MTDEIVPAKEPRKPGRATILLNSYPHRKLVYFEPPVERKKYKSCKGLGVGIFWDGTNEKVAIIPFRETQAGELRWGTRKGAPRPNGKGFYCNYDMVLVSPSILGDLADACRAVVHEWFGGPEFAGERMIANEIKVKEERLADGRDKDTALSELIRKNKVF